MSRSLHLITQVFVTALVAVSFGALAEDQMRRTIDDVFPAVAELLERVNTDAFLIIGISGTDDFVQLSGYQGSAQLDFPQVTERQKDLRAKTESICSDLGLELTVNTSADGAIEFLNYDLLGTPKEISNVVEEVLERLFSVDSKTALEFDAN